MSYGYQNTMRAEPGRRDEVVALLLADQSELAGIGCRYYLVGVNDTEPDLVYVTFTELTARIVQQP